MGKRDNGKIIQKVWKHKYKQTVKLNEENGRRPIQLPKKKKKKSEL